MLRIFSVALFFSLCACGVKLPPIAPQARPKAPPPPVLDCSPKDPDCDRTDPNYRPSK